MEDVRIRIVADADTKGAKLDLSELLRVTDDLVKATDNLRQTTERKNNQSKKGTEEEIGLINNLRKSINELTNARDKSVNQSEIASYNQKIKEQNEELKKLTTTQEKANSLTDQQNDKVGKLSTNTEKSTSMFSSLGKTLLAVFAVDKIIDYSKQLVTLMGDTDKYRVALMNVSESQKDYEKSISFVTKISNDYGQSVNDLTKSYTAFIASSKSSNLPLEERQRIYASIIKAGSALKISNEDVDGSLRAISQMFSKSKVSAEELSQQLGERLPGSLGALAKGMKMSEKDLLKMIENGDVLAKDVLPILATEFEKMYGDKAQSNLKTIGGAWNVFVNNFIEGLQDFNKSSSFIETISEWILSAANSLKVFIGWIKEAFAIGTQYNTVLNKWYDYYEVIYTAISNIVGAGWDLIKSLGQIIANIVGAGDATLTFKKVVDYAIVGIKVLGSVLIGAVTVIQALADAFNIAMNYGMKLANFFGKDFKIDPKATFSNLADNAKTNFGRITNLWNESSSKVLGTAKATNKAIVEGEKDKTKELEKELGKQGNNDKKANKEKLTDFEKYMAKKSERESKYFEDSKKGMDKAVDSYIKALKKQNEEESKAQKELIKESEERKDAAFRSIQKNILIEKVLKAKTLEEIEQLEKEHIKILLNYDLDKLQSKLKIQKQELLIAKSTGSLIKEEELKRKKEIEKLETDILELKDKINGSVIENKKDALKKATDLEKKSAEDSIDIEKKKADKIKEINQAAQQSMLALSSMVLDQIVKDLDEKIGKTGDLVEKARLENKKAWASTGQEALGFLDQLASGNVIGGVFSAFKVFFSAMNNTMNESTRIWEAEVAKLTEELKTGWEVLSGSLDSVKSTYGGLVDDSATLKDLWEDDTIEGRINAEIKIGENINKNFNAAMENEESLHKSKLSNIEKELSDSIDAINKKYEHESTKLTQKFDAESLAISEGVNNDLMKFVANEDLKTSLTDTYESKKAAIKEKFAMAYVPITEGMSEAEINGINDAIKARDEAFAKLADWQTSQIQFVIDNGKLEIDTFTDVQKVIAKGKDDQYQLGLKYQAQQIIDETNKNLAIEAAEKTKNTNIEIETQRHEGVITQLGLDRDAALEASFIRLRDVMTDGYSQMYTAAYNAYLQGKLTAEQFKEAANNLLYLMDLLQKGEIIPKKEDLDTFIEPIIIPKFNTGTELVGGKSGIDKNLAWLSADEAVIKGETNRKKLQAGLTNESAIQYAISYKSILDGGFSPLTMKDNILPKLEERAAMQYLLNMNTQPIIDELKEVRQTLSKLPIQKFVFDKDGVNQYEQTKNSVKIYRKKRFE